MRKATVLLLSAAFVVAAMSGTARAAPAGVGLEWGVVPVINFGDFDMKFSDEFTLAWNVSDKFQVGVFGGDGTYRAEDSYTDVTTTPLAPTEARLVVGGTTAVTGLRLLAAIPGLSFLSAGLEIGTMQFTSTYGAGGLVTRADGSVPLGTEFGTVAPLVTTAELYGLAVKGTVLKASTKTVTTEVTIAGSFRIIDFADTTVLGTSHTTKAVPDAIEAVSNYNNLALTIAVGMWF